MQWSVRTMDSMVMQFHIVAAPLSQQPGKLGDNKSDLKKTHLHRCVLEATPHRIHDILWLGLRPLERWLHHLCTYCLTTSERIQLIIMR